MSRKRFIFYLEAFLVAAVVGAVAVFAGTKLRRRGARIRLRWRKVGGVRGLKDETVDVFTVSIGGVLLYVGGGRVKEEVEDVLRRIYPGDKRPPRNLQVHVGEVMESSAHSPEDVWKILALVLNPPWNSSEDLPQTPQVPITLKSEGEIPPGFRRTLRI